MITKKVLIFGASGQIGRYCIRRLVKNNYKVIAVTRNSHKAVFLKTQAPIGYLEIEQASIFDEKRINEIIKQIKDIEDFSNKRTMSNKLDIKYIRTETQERSDQ